ncbi:MAG: hypothetical protein JWO97_558 [Acidobacteria bacterium]|nr:hypothetical protein [Acidobacteriota bacterium]
MSIYATLWILKFPAEGDDYAGCQWEAVMAQGVPGHIGTPTRGYGYEDADPFASFLPPAIAISENEDDDAPLRAVVFVRERTEKVVQEYINPLLVLSGTEYAAISFAALHERICDALRGEKPRVVAQLFTPATANQC